MRKIVIIAIGIFAAALISACSKNLPDTGATTAMKVSNEWWVTLSQNGNPLTDPVKIATYNTASNPDSIWIDDLENIWPFKCKAKIDLANMTFSTANAESQYEIKVPGSSPAQYYTPTVNIANGKILSNAAKSLSGNPTDSIYMELDFSDDPGTKYVIAGHARTKFSEDEY
jgi:hypothetical protein